MHQRCEKLKELLEAELRVIGNHIDDHKWFQHIDDENEGVKDFIKKYGWIMREMYCGFACPDRENCELAKVFLKDKRKSNRQK